MFTGSNPFIAPTFAESANLIASSDIYLPSSIREEFDEAGPHADGIETDDGNKTVGDFFQDFMPILSDFEQAVESGDTVLIGDLAEYEISPRLSAIAKTLNTLGN